MDRHLSRADEAQLAEALDLRRKQIDREISEFKVEKEKEFRKFEKRLRSEKRDAERQKILQCEREVGKLEGKGRRRGSSLRVEEGFGENEGANGEVVLDGGGKGGSGVRFGGATEIPPESDGGQRKKDSGGPVHEREVEFQGLFTPSFLPLLSGGQGDHDLREDLDNVDPEGVSQSGQRDQESVRSTSNRAAQFSGSAPPIPASPRHLSSTDARKISMSFRRSSSRSDTSVSSLRSSIRDKKQPRSPKRVLFSINNVVVSPSTSPTLQRKNNASRKIDNDQLQAPDPINEKVEIIPSNFSNWQRDPSGQASKTALTNIPTTNNGHVNGTTSKLSHPAAQIGRPSTSPSMGADEFEHIRAEDDDDLFAFDEDIRYRDEDKEGNLEEHDGEGEEELEESVKEELPTSSPHAGSLPIEIRWPGRMDGRG
ncbi:MAG: hypothetical protein L6R41_008213 [Letrouitia leprolyta]|nr:MAG: hypothetical protein L6R41_008213 [Letrouitia leprolyta]